MGQRGFDVDVACHVNQPSPTAPREFG